MSALGEEEDDVDRGGDVPPIGPSSRPRARAPKEPKKRSRAETVSTATTTVVDYAALIRAGAEATNNGASQSRHTVDVVTAALERAYAQVAAKEVALNEKDRTINALQGQITALSAQNPTVALLQVQAEAQKLEAEAKKHETNRRWDGIERVFPKIARELGPQAGPLLTIVGSAFGVKVPPAPGPGPAPPAGAGAGGAAAPAPAHVPSAVRRVFLAMAGEDLKSQSMLAVFQVYVTDVLREDFDAVMTYLTGVDPDADQDAPPRPAGAAPEGAA